MEDAKGRATSLQNALQAAEAANLQLKDEASSLSSKLSWGHLKCDEQEHQISKLQQEVERLATREAELVAREVDLIAEVESLNGEMDTACDKARGSGVQAGFRIFHWITLQL